MVEAAGARYRHIVATGTVVFWRDEEGWGAIEDPDQPGFGFVHFSVIQAEGYRSLSAGQAVQYKFGGDYPHDGCNWRAEWVLASPAAPA